MEPLEGNDLHKLMYGADSADKIKRFQEELNKIDEKYPEFFKERKARLFPEKDKLGFHYMMAFDSYQVRFGFLEESDLPEYIKQECITLFNKVYNEQ